LSVVAFVLWTILSVVLEVLDVVKDVLPFAPWLNALIIGLAALAILIALCFLAGLALRTAFGRRAKDWVEHLLERVIPLYGMAKRLTARFMGGSETAHFTPAEIDLYGSGTTVLGWVVEELPGPRMAVFVPMTPVATFGQIHVLSPDRVRALDIPIPEIMGPISEWGAGLDRIYSKKPSRGGGEKS